MKRRKVSFTAILTAVIVLCMAGFVFSSRVKNMVIMGSMKLGFFKPHIPEAHPGEKLLPAPFMVVQSKDGKVIDLQQQKGKVVFINFWATWCPPCLGELPSINNLYEVIKTDPNIVFLSIDVDNTLVKSSQLLQKRGYNFTVYGGKLDSLPPELFAGTIPTTLIIDKKGFVVYNHTNMANYDDEQFIEYIRGLSKQ